MTDLPLRGRRALVTGASSGIGRALALGLAGQGADLVIHHLGDPDGAAEVARLAGGACRCIEADFSREGAVAALVAGAGPVDILVANAAMERRGPWRDLTVTEIDAHVAVNFTALIQLIQGMVPAMAERGWGRVVAVGSVMAIRPRAETVVYAALKSAQLTAIRAIAREVASQGVTLNVISPGAIETARTADRYADPAFRSAVVAKIPAGRQGQVGDCVGPALFLCGDGAAYVTGANIPVDGGWSIGDAPGGLPEPGRSEFSGITGTNTNT